MPEWTADALDEPGHANPIKLTTFPADGSLRTFVPVWVVRLDDSITYGHTAVKAAAPRAGQRWRVTARKCFNPKSCMTVRFSDPPRTWQELCRHFDDNAAKNPGTGLGVRRAV